MPFQPKTDAIIKIAGASLVTILCGSSISTAAASWLLLDVDSDALGAAESDDRDTRTQAERERDKRREAKLAAAEAKREATQRREQLETIVEHNVFCPSCKPIEAAPQPLASGAGPGMALPATDQPLALLATMESNDPAASMATILDTDRAVTGVFAVNEQIRPGVTLAGVRRGSVTLRVSGGAIQSLGFPTKEVKKPKKKPTKSKKKKKKKSSREIAGAREAIDCSGHDCVVDRRFVDKIIANPAQLMKQARVVPAVRDGETYGFKLYRVRSGTLPNLLGLRNGDTLLSVNGTKLDSMDRAIGLYNKLRRASNLRVSVERKGKVFDKQVSIR